jgi:hypothetical protein
MELYGYLQALGLDDLLENSGEKTELSYKEWALFSNIWNNTFLTSSRVDSSIL